MITRQRKDTATALFLSWAKSQAHDYILHPEAQELFAEGIATEELSGEEITWVINNTKLTVNIEIEETQ